MVSHTESSDQKTLDAREIDGEPFGAIIEALGELSADESLILINSFEPEPLYDVIEARGFEYTSEQIDAEEWHVKITPA